MFQAASSRSKIGILSLLYFTQGLPFGFQAKALPLFLREQGTSLQAIGLTSLLAAPWMLKVLWAPAVDRYWSPRLGRRRSWILPAQGLLCLLCVAAAWACQNADISVLLGIVFLMNLCAATQDIAVDGLAVDLLSEYELGLGNSAQVAGYKVGMITAGGFLVYFSAEMGWYGLFVVMGGLIAAVFSLLIFFKETPTASVDSSESMTLSKVLQVLLQAVRTPSARWLLITVATYKLGESLIDGMFKLYLLDSGYTVSTIALWVSTYGMAASILGSVAGGVLAMRIPLWRALFVTSIVRILPLIGIALLALGPPSDLAVIGLTLAEHFCGGALTTVMFATMMSHTDSRIGATHFTMLATVEVLGKSPAFLASGYLAVSLGYAGLFGLGTLLSLAFLLILLGLKAHMAPASGK